MLYEVITVHIYLAARLVHDAAQLADAGFEDAMRRRIGDHQGCEAVAVLGTFRAQVLDLDVALRVAGDDYHAQADRGGRGRIGAVRGGRNEADIAPVLAARGVVVADREQAAVSYNFV